MSFPRAFIGIHSGGKGRGSLQSHNQILHELLDIGQTLLTSGAEINRVEDTLTRLGRAYGAERVDIFVITSDIVLTMQFSDGVELTQTRRISRAPSTDFQKLEQLNALSRECCAAPLPIEQLHARVQAIAAGQIPAPALYIGSILGAGGFAVFFGGGGHLRAVLVGIKAAEVPADAAAKQPDRRAECQCKAADLDRPSGSFHRSHHSSNCRFACCTSAASG